MQPTGRTGLDCHNAASQVGADRSCTAGRAETAETRSGDKPPRGALGQREATNAAATVVGLATAGLAAATLGGALGPFMSSPLGATTVLA